MVGGKRILAGGEDLLEVPATVGRIRWLVVYHPYTIGQLCNSHLTCVCEAFLSLPRHCVLVAPRNLAGANKSDVRCVQGGRALLR